MRENLLRSLNREINEHREFWDYYGSMSAERVFESDESARQFILEYYRNGSKSRVMKEWKTDMDVGRMFRNTHMVNVFFIGAMLQREKDCQLALLSKQNKDNYPFAYLWFLVCLAHDIGYGFEKEKNDEELNRVRRCYKNYVGKYTPCIGRGQYYRCQEEDIKCMVPSFPIRRYCFVDMNGFRKENEREPICGQFCRGTISYNNGTEIKRGWYDVRTIDRYFFYKLLERKKPDHGIMGADKFFSDIIENYHLNYNNKRREGSFERFKNEEGKWFGCEQFKVFAYIANCIAAHNVFKAANGKTTIDLYNQYGLHRLLPGKFKPISYDKDPLLFMLCVADTLEPTKRFRDYDNREILEHINIMYDAEENLIHVEIDEMWRMLEEAHEYIDNVRELKTWCDIKVVADFA